MVSMSSEFKDLINYSHNYFISIIIIRIQFGQRKHALQTIMVLQLVLGFVLNITVIIIIMCMSF